MERIFELTYKELSERMEKMIPETVEAFREFIIKENLPSCEILKDSVTIIRIVISHLKTRPEKEWKTAVLLSLLYDIAETGEILYMKTVETHRDANEIRRFLDSGRQSAVNLVTFAGMLLAYYYRVHEQKHHSPEDNEKVAGALYLLMSANENVINKSELSPQEEKPMPIRIKEYLDERMTGQEDAKKTVAMAIYRFLEYDERTVVMLEGSTGVGKSFLFENLAGCDFLKDKLTFFSYTATEMTPNGFSGDDVKNMLEAYKKKCRLNSLSRGTGSGCKGVIFIDELDKLFMSNRDSNGEDVNRIVLMQLLTVIAGTATISDVDTKDILFILAGAFENVEDIRKERRKKEKIGFSAVSEREEADQPYDLRKELIELGAPRQFVARISRFVHMDNIDRKMMKRILINPSNGLLTQRMRLFEKDGLEMRVAGDSVIEKLVDQIMENHSGVRGVREKLDAMVGSYDYDMLEDGYQIMVIDENVLNGGKPVFMKKEERNESIVRMDKKSRS